jgi:hypothetical protein
LEEKYEEVFMDSGAFIGAVIGVDWMSGQRTAA